MIEKKVDGRTIQFVLSYNISSLNTETIKGARELTPDEEYWKDKIPLKEVVDYWDEEAGGWRVIPDFIAGKHKADAFDRLSEKLSKTYWITREDYEFFSEVLAGQSIDQLYWSDLMLVGNYLPINKSDYLEDRKILTKQVKEINTLTVNLLNPLFEIDTITINGSFPEAREDENLNPVRVKITEPAFTHNLSRMFKDWINWNPEFLNMMKSYNDSLNDEGASISTYNKTLRSQVLIWLYDYIADKSIAINHHQACLIIGKILSRHHFIPSEERYDQTVKEMGSFKDYNQYLANHMRTTIERILLEKGRTKRFKN